MIRRGFSLSSVIALPVPVIFQELRSSACLILWRIRGSGAQGPSMFEPLEDQGLRGSGAEHVRAFGRSGAQGLTVQIRSSGGKRVS
jgi:hypothetical protein